MAESEEDPKSFLMKVKVEEPGGLKSMGSLKTQDLATEHTCTQKSTFYLKGK